MTRLLHDNITEGTGTAAYTGCAGQAGKTGHHRRIHRRLVRRLPAEPGDRGLGRLPRIERDLDDERARDHRLRRHLPGRNLALALLRSRRPLRGIHRTVAADQLGALLRPVHRRRTRPRSGPAGNRAASAGRRPGPKRSADTTRTPTRRGRARNRRRCRTDPDGAASAAAQPPAPGRPSIAAGLAYGLMWVGFVAYLGRPDLGAEARRDASSGALIVILVAAFASAPVLLSHDVFSYVDYARLGVVHGLDPYVHPPHAAPADPAFAEVTWPHTTSAYGPLFTLATYPLAWLPVDAAVAVLKALAALSVLAAGGPRRPPRRLARRRPAARRSLRRPQPARARPRRRRRPQRRADDAAGDPARRRGRPLRPRGRGRLRPPRRRRDQDLRRLRRSVRAGRSGAQRRRWRIPARSAPTRPRPRAGAGPAAGGGGRGGRGDRGRQLPRLRLGVAGRSRTRRGEPGPDEPSQPPDHRSPASPASAPDPSASPPSSSSPLSDRLASRLGVAQATGSAPPPGPASASSSPPPGCSPGT